MAVRLEGSTRRWIGLSSDEKPIPGHSTWDPKDNVATTIEATDVPPGSSFLETDTGRIQRWDGSAWAVYVPADEQSEYLQAILTELASLREVLVESLA